VPAQVRVVNAVYLVARAALWPDVVYNVADHVIFVRGVMPAPPLLVQPGSAGMSCT
jgi:hypothetical protein